MDHLITIAMILAWTIMAMLSGAGLLHCFKPWQYHSHVHLHKDTSDIPGYDPGDEFDDEDEDDEDDVLYTHMPMEDYEPREN